jgi:hypothetical protein
MRLVWYAPEVVVQITRNTVKAEKLPLLPGELGLIAV